MKSIFKKILFVTLFLNILNAQNLDIDKLLSQAKKENKTLMFFFHMPSCPYCKKMKQENFKNKEILTEINKNFVLFKISIYDEGLVRFKDFKGSKKEFSKYLKASTYPSTVFLDEKGEIVHLARGYRNIGEYLVEIKYIATKSYKKMDIQEFADELEMSEDD